jgi:FMN phosphatase YigB (HAD superfamily)
MMTPVRAVFFDIGETLVERPEVGPGRRLADALGLGADHARVITSLVFRTVFASPTALAERLRSELGLTDDPAPAVTAIWNAQLTEPCEIPGATACVAAVRAAGARVGVISNIWAPYAEGFRRACPDIVPLVDSWHLSFEGGTLKPNAAIFHAALAALQVAPAAALMVGDSLEKDIGPAVALGMSAVWLRREHATAAASDEPAVVAVDPHRARKPSPAEVVPEGAVVARNLSEVRRIALTWLWAKGGAGTSLTAPLATGRSPS